MAINWKELEKKKGTIVAGTNENIIYLETKGESFIGKYLGKGEPVQIGDKKPFDTFNFETKDGFKSFSGGMSFAQSIGIVKANSIVKVTFNGKKKTSSGNKVNLYTVELLSGAIDEKAKKALQAEIVKNMKKNKKKGGKK